MLFNSVVAMVAALFMLFSRAAKSFEMIVLGRFLYGYHMGKFWQRATRCSFHFATFCIPEKYGSQCKHREIISIEEDLQLLDQVFILVFWC